MKTIADHLFDILENSVNAQANKIVVKLSFNNKIFSCQIRDNGIATNLEDVTDPFVTSRKTRKVGLGLPLLKATVEATGGYLEIVPLRKKSGTKVKFNINMNHIDARPFGDLAAVFTDALLSWPEVDFEIRIVNHKQEKKILDTVDLKKDLQTDQLNNIEIQDYIKKYLQDELIKIGINQQFGD